MAETPTVVYEGEPFPVKVGVVDVVQLPSRILRARLTGMTFDSMRTFLLPSALNNMQRLAAYYDETPAAEVLVVGHTDTSGSTAYNLTLSTERAQSMVAFLRDDVDAWLTWYEGDGAAGKRWDAREDKHMLAALGFFAGAVDPEETPALEDALTKFQESEGLAQSGTADATTRRALVTAYMGVDHTTLPAGTTIVAHGCGETHQEVETADGVDEPENRRVEVYLFEHGIDPAPASACPAGGCGEWAKWVLGTTETVDLSDQPPVPEGKIFHLELFDDVLLPSDTELVVHGLATPLRLMASEHHDPEEGVYSFPIHDPPPGSSCRATLVSERATKVLFDGVDLSAFIDDAVAAGAPPFLPIDLPDEAFDVRVEDEAAGEEPPESEFVKGYEDLVHRDEGDRDFPRQHEHSGVFEETQGRN